MQNEQFEKLAESNTRKILTDFKKYLKPKVRTCDECRFLRVLNDDTTGVYAECPVKTFCLWEKEDIYDTTCACWEEKMLTKKYKNGCVTLNAEMFSPVIQETIDREIKNFEPARVAVEKLYEYEQKDIPKGVVLAEEEYCCPNCGNDTNILSDDKYCVECGQALDWSDVR